MLKNPNIPPIRAARPASVAGKSNQILNLWQKIVLFQGFPPLS
jgi:hypothetical protein